jgi:hypothetical protein
MPSSLYLSQRWDLDEDGWFVGPASRTLGVWLSDKCIVSLEIYAVGIAKGLERETPKIRR